MRRYCLLLMLIIPLLAACGGTRTYAGREDFEADPRHQRDFAEPVATVCEAARRVLLGDGYIVDKDADLNLIGVKEFQIVDERHAILRFYASCDQTQRATTLFVTATEHHFDVKTSRQTTSIGVPLLPPISLRSRREVDNLVKTLGETVTDRNFYERFYRAVQQELAREPSH